MSSTTQQTEQPAHRGTVELTAEEIRQAERRAMSSPPVVHMGDHDFMDDSDEPRQFTVYGRGIEVGDVIRPSCGGTFEAIECYESYRDGGVMNHRWFCRCLVQPRYW